MLRGLPLLLLAPLFIVGGGRGLAVAAAQGGAPRALTLEAFLRAPPDETWVRLEGCVPDFAAGRVRGTRYRTAYVPLKVAGREAEPARVLLVSRDGGLISLLRRIDDDPGAHNLPGILPRYPAWTSGPLALEGTVGVATPDQVEVLGRGGLTLAHDQGPGVGSLVSVLFGLLILGAFVADVVKARRAARRERDGGDVGGR